MSSAKSLAGKSLRAMMTAGECAVKYIGSKSREGLYFRFGASTGAATCDPMLPASKVSPSGADAATRALQAARIPKSSQNFARAVHVDQVEGRRTVRSISDLRERRAALLLPVSQTSRPFDTS